MELPGGGTEYYYVHFSRYYVRFTAIHKKQKREITCIKVSKKLKKQAAPP